VEEDTLEANMEFGNTTALYFLAAGAVAALLYAYELLVSGRALRNFAASGILHKIVRGYSPRRKIVRRALTVAVVILLVLAWAMPRLGMGSRLVEREGADVVVALDVSMSMYAEDVRPNRLEVAKQAVGTLISRLREDRFALVGFAGDAFINCPLTLDSGALAMFLDFLNPGAIAEQGTDIAAAISESLKALEASSGRGRAIVLITDGENHGDGLDQVLRNAVDRNVKIFTLGVGTPGGEPIPVRDASGAVTSYKRDNSDNVVVSRLDTDLLEHLARTTGGESRFLGLGDRAVGRVAEALERLEKGTLEERSFEYYLELFQLPLGICFILLIIEGVLGDRKR
jgi:Ca-activated chloride channel family protein